MKLLNVCNMSWFCTFCFVQKKNERGMLTENREKVVIQLIPLPGLVGNTVSTGDSIVKWHMHTYESQ